MTHCQVRSDEVEARVRPVPFVSPARPDLPTPNQRYKEFLDGLVPSEWFEEQHRIKSERQEARRQARIKKKKKAYEVDGPTPCDEGIPLIADRNT